MKVYILEYWHDCDEENCGIYGVYSSLEYAKKIADKIAKKEGQIKEFSEGEWEPKKTGRRGVKAFQKEWVMESEGVFRIYTITECKFVKGELEI